MKVTRKQVTGYIKEAIEQELATEAYELPMQEAPSTGRFKDRGPIPKETDLLTTENLIRLFEQYESFCTDDENDRMNLAKLIMKHFGKLGLHEEASKEDEEE
jgi:hypothetical protein